MEQKSNIQTYLDKIDEQRTKDTRREICDSASILFFMLKILLIFLYRQMAF